MEEGGSWANLEYESPGIAQECVKLRSVFFKGKVRKLKSSSSSIYNLLRVVQ